MTEQPKVETANIIDVQQAVSRGEPVSHEVHLKVAAKLVELDAAIIYCHQAKIDWFEVDEDVLKYFCKGVLPGSGYFVYKGVKLCLPNTAESIAKRDGLDCNQIVFPTDSYIRVGVKPGLK